MGKAIAAVSILLVCSFCWVLWSLWSRRPPERRAAAGPPPLVESRPDGSITSVTTRIDVLERRLMEQEARAGELQAQVNSGVEERQRLTEQIQGLQAEIRRLRTHVTDRSQLPTGNAPSSTPPVPPEGTGGEPTIPP